MKKMIDQKRTFVLKRRLKKNTTYSIIKPQIYKAGEIMLDKVIESTNGYIDTMPKKERKKYGQFFTSMETARFMASLYDRSPKAHQRL